MMAAIIAECCRGAARVSYNVDCIVGVITIGCLTLLGCRPPPEASVTVIIKCTRSLSCLIYSGQVVERVISVVGRRVSAAIPIQLINHLGTSKGILGIALLASM